MNPSLFERNTFWTTVVGYFFQWLSSISVHPGVLQRQITVPNYRKSQMYVHSLNFLEMSTILI